MLWLIRKSILQLTYVSICHDKIHHELRNHTESSSGLSRVPDTIFEQNLVATVKKVYEDWPVEVLSLLSPSPPLELNWLCVEQNVAKLNKYLKTTAAVDLSPSLLPPSVRLLLPQESIVRGSEFIWLYQMLLLLRLRKSERTTEQSLTSRQTSCLLSPLLLSRFQVLFFPREHYNHWFLLSGFVRRRFCLCVSTSCESAITAMHEPAVPTV